MKRKDLKKYNIYILTVSLLIIILVNIIVSYINFRIDLTEEKRYTLSKSTVKILKNLDDIVFFKVYLDGEFPAGFKRLQQETKEMLNQFRAYSNNIEYEFINPMATSDNKQKRAIYNQLINSGLDPTNLQTKDKNGRISQQIIFPGAIVSYKGREVPMQLLISQYGESPEKVLNNSIESLEFAIASAIKKLMKDNTTMIGLIQGHGELKQYELADIALALSDYYRVKFVRLDNKIKSLKDFKAIIIAKPDSTFDEKDKFIIDQFIMHGGKTLWLLDASNASMDSLTNNDNTLVSSLNTNLDDMMFRYGVKIQKNIIIDLQAIPIPVITGRIGNQPQYDKRPWVYFPMIIPKSNHPIVKNINAIKTEFVGSIDTVTTPKIKKMPLLSTSKYSRIINLPAVIDINVLNREPNPYYFNNPYQNIAMLLEGKFTSLYKHRIPPEIEENKEIDFKEESNYNKMIVVSDGDIIKNQVTKQNGEIIPYPLGYDKYNNYTFGNKDFILNAINYLLDDDGLIYLRSRDIKLRMLDKTRLTNNRLYIQTVNVILPIFILIVAGIIVNIIRKNKYSSTL